jgi:hypothetical protein
MTRLRLFPPLNRPALLLLVLLLLAGRFSAVAQFGGAGSPGVSASLIRMFGTNRAFTAQVEVQVLGKDNKEQVGTPMTLALLDTKVRLEVDLTRMRNREQANVLAQVKPLGMDSLVSVFRPDLRATCVVFPKLRAFVKLPMPDEEADAFTKPARMERTPLGKEKMEGHPCVKYRVVITDEKGKKHEATVWNASDLRDFPVCVATRESEGTVVMRFRQVQFVPPSATLFEPPAGYQACADMQALMAGPAANYLVGASAATKPAKAATPAVKARPAPAAATKNPK